MYTFYCYKKCSTCKKAENQLKESGVEFTTVDLKDTPPEAAQILKWIETSGLDRKKFFNTSGQKYRELGLKDKVEGMTDAEAAHLLSTDGMLIKRPILVEDDRIKQIAYRKPYEL